jgi:hypothetical protein
LLPKTKKNETKYQQKEIRERRCKELKEFPELQGKTKEESVSMRATMMPALNGPMRKYRLHSLPGREELPNYCQPF